MEYSEEEVIQYALEEDVKFIRLTFCDVFGRQKNISIMPGMLQRAFERGIPIDASAIDGFSGGTRSELLLHPEAGTLAPLPWRPEHGRVVQMFSHITHPDGSPFAGDTRSLLRRAVDDAKRAGFAFTFGINQEFYLFCLDEEGRRTATPCDEASYMDIAPEDHGENVRREICLTLERMGICPQNSYHEAGPGQNEIDFLCADALTAADDAMLFQRTVRTVAHRNGYHADFSPKPLPSRPGNGLHISMSTTPCPTAQTFCSMVAGTLEHVAAMTAFLNPAEASYQRLAGGADIRHPQLVDIPADTGDCRSMELRSPDPLANPYLAFALMIWAGLDGIERRLSLPAGAEIDLSCVEGASAGLLASLPSSLGEARAIAQASPFVAAHVPAQVVARYCAD